MPGPWDHFAPQAAPTPADGPWNRFAPPQGAQGAGEYGYAPAPDQSPTSVGNPATASASTPPQPSGPQQSGLGANAVAGAEEGVASAINTATDPVSYLITKPLATLGMGAVNLGARAFGYQPPISPQAMHDLLEDDVPTPGGRVVAGAAHAIGALAPADVVPATSAERYLRAGAAGAVGMGAAGPAGLVAGAAGGLGSQAAADVAPADLKPSAALLGNVVGMGAPKAVAIGTRAALSPAANALMSYAEGGGPTVARMNPLIEVVGQPAPSAANAGMTATLADRAPLSSPNGTGAVPSQRASAKASPGVPQSAPSSLGAAATPSGMTAMNPREAAASQATAENYRLNDLPPAGEDRTEYVKGVVPTAAEVMGDGDLSTEQKYIAQTPGQIERFRVQQAANNDARISHYDDLAGTPTIVNTMKDARDAQAQQDLAAAWSNKRPVDAQPVVDQISEALKGPDGKLSAVSSALSKVRDLLQDDNGNLETDPEVLYGARREVANMLGKAAQQEKPTLKDAARQLTGIKDSLDQAIETGAPGYGQYLQNYATASKPINARELLLNAKPDLLTGAGGNMTFGKVHGLMKNIVAQRQASGVNGAKALDDAQMEGLWNLHNDLRRQSNIDLGKARGSDTNMMGRMGGALGLGTAHVLANKLLPVAGSFMVNEGKNALAERKISRRANQLMDGLNYKP